MDSARKQTGLHRSANWFPQLHYIALVSAPFGHSAIRNKMKKNLPYAFTTANESSILLATETSLEKRILCFTKFTIPKGKYRIAQQILEDAEQTPQLKGDNADNNWS